MQRRSGGLKSAPAHVDPDEIAKWLLLAKADLPRPRSLLRWSEMTAREKRIAFPLFEQKKSSQRSETESSELATVMKITDGLAAMLAPRSGGHTGQRKWQR